MQQSKTDKEQLEELNQALLERLQEYSSKKKNLSKEQHEELHKAKNEWQASWAKLQEVLMVLERIEI